MRHRLKTAFSLCVNWFSVLYKKPFKKPTSTQLEEITTANAIFSTIYLILPVGAQGWQKERRMLFVFFTLGELFQFSHPPSPDRLFTKSFFLQEKKKMEKQEETKTTHYLQFGFYGFLLSFSSGKLPTPNMMMSDLPFQVIWKRRERKTFHVLVL